MIRILNGRIAIFGTMLIAAFVMSVGLQAAAGKVKICHVPPGNPDNFHSISVNTDAIQSHLEHGDSPFPCNANCEAACNDFDACTMDVASEPGSPCFCFSHPPQVDCEDNNPCTNNYCSESGCFSEAVERLTVCERSDGPGICWEDAEGSFCGVREPCEPGIDDECGFIVRR